MSEKKYIQSIQRASMILDYIASVGSVKLNELCQVTGLKTSTAFGILQTLEHTGHVTRCNNGLEYTLGLNSLKLGLSYINSAGLNDKIHTLLTEMVNAVDETAYFELKIGDRYYYLDVVVSSQPLKVVPDDSKFIDLPENSAVAKVFNDYSKDLKYAIDLEQVDEGLNCFAVPYRSGDAIVGCVALTGPSYRFTKEKMESAYTSFLEIMKKLDLENHI